MAGEIRLPSPLKKIAQGRAKVALRLHEFRQSGAMKDALADTPSGGNLGLADAITGVLTGVTTNGGSTATASDAASALFVMPVDYDSGSDFTVSINAGVSVVRTVSSSVDLAAEPVVFNTATANKKDADLCVTAATAITATYADKDFVVSGSGLEPGSVVDLTVTLAANDTGGSSNGIATIRRVNILYDRL